MRDLFPKGYQIIQMSSWGNSNSTLRNITDGDVYENDMTFGGKLKNIDLKNRFLNVVWFFIFCMCLDFS